MDLWYTILWMALITVKQYYLSSCELFIHCRIAGEMPKAFVILDDVVQHTLTNLHIIHKSLQFWQAKAEV